MSDCTYDLGAIKTMLDASGLSQPEIMIAIKEAAARKGKGPCSQGCEKGCTTCTSCSSCSAGKFSGPP